MLDEATVLKRGHHEGKRIIQKMGGLSTETDWPTAMPEKLEDYGKPGFFPIRPTNRYVGILHADINNLGSIYQDLFQYLTDENYLKASKAFSEAVEQSIVEAVKQAVIQLTKVNWKTIPARPLVLAGDDVTFILRGDTALGFTKNFLAHLCEK